MWKKESLFVDLMLTEKFKPFLNNEQNIFPMMAPKSNIVSLEKRKEGNKRFADREWSLAMEKYNESLCFSEQGSENISLAYANRSACFFHLNLFNECLGDIELAKKAGYPNHLLPKLEQRKVDCLKVEQKKEEGYKLCAEPNKKFPSMANVMRIERKANGEYSMIATKDLSVFQTVMIEKPIFQYLYGMHGTKCNICLKENANLVSCDKCTCALFCSDECKNHFLHVHECGIKFCDDKQRNYSVLNEIRALLLAINLFGNADELMEFVEKAMKGNAKGIPESMIDLKSQYRAFLQYPIDSKFTNTHEYADIVFNTYRFIMSIPNIRDMFMVEKHRRFLMHLISQHVCIMNRNLLRSGDKLKEGPDNHFSYLPPMSQFFKQVYAPNLLTFRTNENIAYVTSHNIRKGEELTIGFLFLRDYEEYDKKRKAAKNHQAAATEQERLSGHFLKFKSNCKPDCKCTRCKTPSNQQLNADPDLEYLLTHGSSTNYDDHDSIQELVNNVDAFWKKNGPGMLLLNEPKKK